MSDSASLVDYYAQRAAEYERIYSKPERQPDLQQLKAMLWTTLAGRRVLEIACGTGYWTQVVSETAASIVATDINEAVLEIARRKPVDPRNVTFCLGDAYQPAVPAPPCDAFLAAFWWSHIPRERLEAFLDGLRSVLPPDALVIFIDNNFVAGNSTPLSRTDALGNTYQRRTLEDGRGFEVLKNFPTDDELHAAGSKWLGQRSVKRLTYFWWLEAQVRNECDALGVTGSKSAPHCS